MKFEFKSQDGEVAGFWEMEEDAQGVFFKIYRQSLHHKEYIQVYGRFSQAQVSQITHLVGSLPLPVLTSEFWKQLVKGVSKVVQTEHPFLPKMPLTKEQKFTKVDDSTAPEVDDEISSG